MKKKMLCIRFESSTEMTIFLLSYRAERTELMISDNQFIRHFIDKSKQKEKKVNHLLAD